MYMVLLMQTKKIKTLNLIYTTQTIDHSRNKSLTLLCHSWHFIVVCNLNFVLICQIIYSGMFACRLSLPKALLMCLEFYSFFEWATKKEFSVVLCLHFHCQDTITFFFYIKSKWNYMATTKDLLYDALVLFWNDLVNQKIYGMFW